ncbi:MAG: hypothetical protein Q8P31_08770, partial [Bacillota bacterium]|nr:hypothetical protein [Bacillota bacterium]
MILAVQAAAAGSGVHTAPGAPESVAASWLWLLLLLLPAAAALSQPLVCRLWRGGREAVRGGLWAAGWCAAVAVMLAGSWAAGLTQGRIELPGFIGRGMSLEVTPLGLLFALFASFLWMMAALFSLTYLASSHAQGRYYFYFLLCLAG